MNLAKERVYRFGYFLPKTGGAFLQELHGEIKSLSRALKADSVEVSVKRTLPPDPHKTAGLLSRITTTDYDGVAILAPDSPQVRDAVTRIKERRVHVVRLISGAD
ncbi:MAG: hypothetical protein AAF714_12490 [Pseudomonadota bacterium]